MKLAERNGLSRAMVSHFRPNGQSPHIDLDPCNLHPGEEQVVARQLVACLRAG